MKKKNADRAAIGERAGAVLFSQWNEFCALREVAIGQGDLDSIHDLRVTSRRMRATIGLFEPFIAAKNVKNASKELRRVTRELGRLRNIDEGLIYFNAVPSPLPALIGMLSAAREKEMQAVTDVLKSFPRQSMDRLFRKAVAELVGVSHDDQALSAHLSETSVRRYQNVYDLFLPAQATEMVETRHALRIAIKKWRYLLETVGQVCGKDFSIALEALKEYQTILGRLNDMVEFSAMCTTLKLPKHESEEIATACARDSAAYLARFIETASARPLQYTFSL